MASLPDPTEARLLQALASLNQIGAAINGIGAGEEISSASSLQLIAESATRVAPDAAAAIYTYDAGRDQLQAAARAKIAPADDPALDRPRADGLGARAIRRRRSVLSAEEPDIGVHPHHAARGVRAAGCFPLVVAEQVVGALYIYLRAERAFTRFERLLFDNFANQAAMAIYHARRLEAVRRDLARQQDELDRLRRAALLISSRLRLEETLESILQLALEMTGAHYGIFRLLDRSGAALVTRAFAGDDMHRPKIEALPLSADSVMGQVARTRAAVLIPDLRAAPWSVIYYPLDAGLEMRSELAVPLINASGRLEGVLNLESPTPGAFDERDRHLLQSLAVNAVTAIQEVRLLDALQESARQILSQPCAQALDHLAGVACDLLNASAAAIWLLEPAGAAELTLKAARGGHPAGERLPLAGSLVGQVVRDRAALMVADVRAEPHFHAPELARTHNWSRALLAPLPAEAEAAPLGAFAIYSDQADPGRFAESDWDRKVLTFLAHSAALAVQNERRQQALRVEQEQRAVAETFAAVGDVASNLLHQLNNKIGTIPVRVQNIQDKCAPALEANAYLARNLAEIERCAMQAMQTVRDNLAHLRPIRLEPVRVAERLAEALQAAQLPAGIRVQTEGLEQLPLVRAGGPGLAFVFANLIDNAVEAMRGQGDLRVIGRAGPQEVEIAVSDDGPGIPPELHERIFELNYSASRPGQLGFGLWWVKTLMTRLGGAVSVESDSPAGSLPGARHGATFRLRLPRAEVPA